MGNRSKKAIMIVPLVGLAVAAGYVVRVSSRTHLSMWQLGKTYLMLNAHAETTTPHTIVLTEFLTSGPASFQNPPHRGEAVGTHLFALRSDGSFVIKHVNFGYLGPSGVLINPSDERTVIDLQKGQKLFVREFLNATQTYTLPPEAMQDIRSSRRLASSDCLLNAEGKPAWADGKRVLGREVVAGFETVVIGGTGYKMWLAPALGCSNIRLEYPSYNDKGQLISLAEQKPTSITLGEPSDLLFQALGDELKPSDAYKRQIALWHLDEVEKMRKNGAHLQNEDNKYLALHR